ncbi:hypothetical protein CN514_00355 [Bacillus sp. AFS001701]|uniref:hypothetical protein n=1 Tax=Bacillus sp. AFS001701 TaxID=2033480 RepID=UPI000BF97626|nr:hypothetical protein [Bacillus sp. AFS001701]PET78079.1 hypothetical protein CN514_00355 [Bacillus sp. AFS001701]
MITKSYSEADLLYYDYCNRKGKTFFRGMNKLFGVALNIEIPSAHFTRLTTICREFRKKTGGVIFINKLIEFLVQDFIEEISMTANRKDIYRRIINMDHSVEITGINDNEVSKIHSLPNSYFSNLQSTRVIFKYDDIYRLEVILADLDVLHEHEYTAEKLIGYLVSAFVIDIQQSGLGKVMKELTTKLDLGEEC